MRKESGRNITQKAAGPKAGGLVHGVNRDSIHLSDINHQTGARRITFVAMPACMRTMCDSEPARPLYSNAGTVLRQALGDSHWTTGRT
jgi:hypothetical protein